MVEIIVWKDEKFEDHFSIVTGSVCAKWMATDLHRARCVCGTSAAAGNCCSGFYNQSGSRSIILATRWATIDLGVDPAVNAAWLPG